METQARMLIAQRFAESLGYLPQLEADTHQLRKESMACSRDLCDLQPELHVVQQRADHLENRLFEFRDFFKEFEEDDPLWKAFCSLHDRFLNVRNVLKTVEGVTRDPRVMS